MTFWDHLVNNSTLAEAEGDTWEHLINPSGEGGGADRLVPYDDLLLDIQVDRMGVDMQKNTLNIEVQRKEIDVELGTNTLSIDIQNQNKEVDNGCNR